MLAYKIFHVNKIEIADKICDAESLIIKKFPVTKLNGFKLFMSEERHGTLIKRLAGRRIEKLENPHSHES